MDIDDFLQLQEELSQMYRDIRAIEDRLFELTPTLQRYSSLKGVSYHLHESGMALIKIQGKMHEHERTKAIRQALGLDQPKENPKPQEPDKQSDLFQSDS